MEPSPRSISRSLAFALSLHGMMFMGALMRTRDEMTKENQSAFEINGGNRVFVITAVVALFAVEVTSVILFFKNIPSRYYTILRSIDVFLVYLSPFLLMAVLNPPTENKLMTSMIACVVIAVTLVNVCFGIDDYDKNLNRSSPIAILTYLGLVLVPVSLLLVLFVPINLNCIVFPVICLCLAVEAICFCSIYFQIMIPQTNQENQKPQHLEAQKGKNKINQA